MGRRFRFNCGEAEAKFPPPPQSFVLQGDPVTANSKKAQNPSKDLICSIATLILHVRETVGVDLHAHWRQTGVFNKQALLNTLPNLHVFVIIRAS